MADREKVIKAYEDFVNGYECFCTSDDYEYEMHKAVLALLKEQDEVVRCKDCKWHTMRGEMLLCTAQDKPHTYDWFCADGERK